jgi:acetylornithine deacetylase/succinyl-diaminopimelate desuccinylase-like protein
LPPNVSSALNAATKEVFGEEREPFYIGVGGSIPFMEVFMREFPGTNFMLTGCCFPDSNAHSANENLDLKFCAKLTSVIALILAKIQ